MKEAGWRRQSARDSLLPITRKTAEDDDEEEDWDLTLNTCSTPEAGVPPRRRSLT
jgi:hypothetical protein